MAHAARHVQTDDQQLALYEEWMRARRAPRRAAVDKSLCARCRAHEARYGFRDDYDDPQIERPRTLCFECFRAEIDRRQAIAARLARGWNAEQVRLPLDETLKELTRRRRRAQIAARHAIGA
jgi:hypothetical protein